MTKVLHQLKMFCG